MRLKITPIKETDTMARHHETTFEDDSYVLTYEEAYQRAWEAAEQMEELMGQYTDE